jgi:hypothetical protein
MSVSTGIDPTPVFESVPAPLTGVMIFVEACVTPDDRKYAAEIGVGKRGAKQLEPNHAG